MTWYGAIALFVVLSLSACGARQQAAPIEDQALRQHGRAAANALSLDRPSEAIQGYQRALERARARDDANAIGDFGYNLAVAQLAANRPRDAIESVRQTASDLGRRGLAPFPSLLLAEATAWYRVGDWRRSAQIAVTVAVSGDSTAAARANFLLGLIADETGDASALDRAIGSVANPATPDQQANEAELLARRDLRRNDLPAALRRARDAVDIRRTILDYRGMARALAVAGEAEERARNTRSAADFFLRAGQSAAAQGDAGAARRWLARSVRLWNEPAARDAVGRALDSLEKSEPPSEQN